MKKLELNQMEILEGGTFTCQHGSIAWGMVIGIGLVTVFSGGAAAVGVGALLIGGGAINGTANELFCRD